MASEIIKLARRIRALEATSIALSSAPQLAHSSIMDGAVDQKTSFLTGYDDLGNPVFEERLVSRYGQQDDGSNTVSSFEGPTPPRPVGFTVTGGAGYLAVEWFGEFEDRFEPYLDHDYVAVHVGTSSGFTPMADTLKGTLRASQGESLTVGGLAAGTYFVTLVAVSVAGVWGPASPYGSGAPGESGGGGAGVDVTARQMAQDALDSAAAAIAAAAGAAALVDGKNSVYRQNTPPVNPALVEDDLWLDSANGNRLFTRVGGEWVAAPLDTEALKPGAITADLLAAQIILGTAIIAGETDQAYAQLDGDGLTLFSPNPDFDAGEPPGPGNEQTVVSSRLGAGGESDFFQIFDSVSGSTVASIDQLGGMSASSGSFGLGPGDVSINGQPFESYFDATTRGLVVWGRRVTAGTSSTTESPFLEVQAMLPGGRAYKIETSPFFVGMSNATNLIATLRMAAGGGAVGIASAQVDSLRFGNFSGKAQTYKAPPLTSYIAIAEGVEDREYRFLVSYFVESGATAYISASAAYPVYLTITDMGPSLPETGIDRSAAPPPAGTKNNYVTNWKASHSATYSGSGSKRGDDRGDMVQGYHSSNGNQHAVALFAGGAVSSSLPRELGKTIPDALSGATLTAAYVYVYFRQWYYGTGGTGLLGWSTDTSLPGTHSATTYNTVSGKWPNPGGRLVRLASPTAAIRAVTLGIAPSTSPLYYGRAAGATGTNPPVLRLHYTR